MRSVGGRAPGVVARADRRGAQEMQPPRLAAEAREEHAVEEQDVVRVEAVEAACGRAAGEVRVREHADALDSRVHRRPLRVGQLAGRPDVDVGDPEPAQVADVGLGRLHRSAPIRLEVGGDGQSVAPRRAEQLRQPAILARAPSPPGRDHDADAGRCDLAHLRVDDERVGRRVDARAPGRSSTRRPPAAASRPAASACSGRRSSASRTTGSRRSRPARTAPAARARARSRSPPQARHTRPQRGQGLAAGASTSADRTRSTGRYLLISGVIFACEPAKRKETLLGEPLSRYEARVAGLVLRRRVGGGLRAARARDRDHGRHGPGLSLRDSI